MLWIGFRYTSLMNESKSNTTSNKSASKAGGKAKRGRGRPASIGAEAFVAVWSKSKSLDDVIKAFKVTRDMDPADAKNYASVRASMLRAKGFSVKQFTRGRKPKAKPLATDKPTA